MTTLLTPDQRQRLVKLLGMLGSDHDGERASAALLASRLLREKGLGWDQIITAGNSAQAPQALRPWPRSPSPPSVPRPWQEQARMCLRASHVLDTWEQGLVDSLSRRLKRPTDSQMHFLQRVVEKVQRAEGWANA